MRENIQSPRSMAAYAVLAECFKADGVESSDSAGGRAEPLRGGQGQGPALGGCARRSWVQQEQLFLRCRRER